MELYILQIKTSALCLLKVTPESRLTTLKLSGEPINEIDQPSAYIKRIMSRLEENDIHSLDQISLSISYDALPQEHLNEWGALLLQAKNANIKQLRQFFVSSVAPSDQLTISEAGIKCQSAEGIDKGTLPFSNIGLEKSKTSALVPQLAQAKREDSEQLELLKAQLIELSQRVESLEEKTDLDTLASTKDEPYRVPINLSAIYGEYKLDFKSSIRRFYRLRSSKIETVSIGSKLMQLSTKSSSASDSEVTHEVRSLMPNGYFFFIPSKFVHFEATSLTPEQLNLVYGVISSDPQDTLPAIKAWLASHSIPFYQDR